MIIGVLNYLMIEAIGYVPWIALAALVINFVRVAVRKSGSDVLCWTAGCSVVGVGVIFGLENLAEFIYSIMLGNFSSYFSLCVANLAVYVISFMAMIGIVIAVVVKVPKIPRLQHAK